MEGDRPHGAKGRYGKLRLDSGRSYNAQDQVQGEGGAKGFSRKDRGFGYKRRRLYNSAGDLEALSKMLETSRQKTRAV